MHTKARVALRVVILLSAVMTIVFVISFFFSKEGISELQEARRRVSQLEQDVAHLRGENQRLAGEIANVRSSDFTVERIAREDLGMARPGEIVYVLPEKPRPPAPVAAAANAQAR